MSKGDAKVPVSVITGFLGSGKHGADAEMRVWLPLRSSCLEFRRLLTLAPLAAALAAGKTTLINWILTGAAQSN